jgi:hypothetical protein
MAKVKVNELTISLRDKHQSKFVITGENLNSITSIKLTVNGVPQAAIIEESRGRSPDRIESKPFEFRDRTGAVPAEPMLAAVGTGQLSVTVDVSDGSDNSM